MGNETNRNIKLGLFVLAGTVFLIIILYLIGDKRSLFGSTFNVSAEFRNVNGLMPGNNVRFGGIDVGTVESIELSTDSSVNVTMVIDESARKFLKKDAIAAVGTDGLMGNKLVSINSGHDVNAPLLENGDKLKTLNPIETDEMFRTLSTTNENIKFISRDLREITAKLNKSKSLWSILTDTVLAENVRQAVVNIKITGDRTATLTGDLQKIVEEAHHGKGLVASLLTDTSMSGRLENTIVKLEKVGDRMVTVSGDFSKVFARIDSGKGTIGMLVMDTSFVHDLKSTVKNANSAAAGLNDNMEALKHSFLLRKYFRKKDKKVK